MPNHVEQRVTLIPRPGCQVAFEALSSPNNPLDFEKVIPLPDPLPADWHNDRYGTGAWYNWQIENWGTKWNSYGWKERSGAAIVGDGFATYQFQTAWSPPTNVFEKLFEMGFDLYVSLTEEDMNRGRFALVMGDDGKCRVIGDRDEWEHVPYERFNEDAFIREDGTCDKKAMYAAEDAYFEARRTKRFEYVTTHDEWVRGMGVLPEIPA